MHVLALFLTLSVLVSVVFIEKISYSIILLTHSMVSSSGICRIDSVEKKTGGNAKFSHVFREIRISENKSETFNIRIEFFVQYANC